jgi:hypothetical protein
VSGAGYAPTRTCKNIRMLHGVSNRTARSVVVYSIAILTALGSPIIAQLPHGWEHFQHRTHVQYRRPAQKADLLGAIFFEVIRALYECNFAVRRGFLTNFPAFLFIDPLLTIIDVHCIPVQCQRAPALVAHRTITRISTSLRYYFELDPWDRPSSGQTSTKDVDSALRTCRFPRFLCLRK